MAENLRFPEEGSSAQGKSGAKARPRGVVDAQTVDIPLPPKMLSTGTQEHSLTRSLVEPGVRERKIVAKQVIVHWREKPCEFLRRPYRKPTQVDEERILRPAGEGLLRNSAY